MIGKEIGAGNTENARRLYKNTIFLIISVASSMFIINYILRKHFIKIFTNSQEIQEKGLGVFVVILIVLFFDFFQTVMQGFIKALNMQ